MLLYVTGYSATLAALCNLLNNSSPGEYGIMLKVGVD